MTPGGNLRNAQNLTNLVEREPFLVPQRDRFTLIRPERRHGGLQRTLQRNTLDWIRRQRRRRLRRGRVPRPSGSVDGNCTNPTSPHGVYPGVVSDAENPRGQTSGDVECCEIAEGLDEGLLSEILRERPVTSEANQQRQNGPLVATDDLLESRLRASERLRYQSRFAYAIEINPDRRLDTRSYVRLRKHATMRCRPRKNTEKHGPEFVFVSVCLWPVMYAVP
jgi:hypothetical protein